MKNYYEQTVGEIVEQLIRIKDRGSVITRRDIESINNACNILSHTFNKSEMAGVLSNEYFASIRWQKEDIKQVLIEKGFEPSDENVNIVLNNDIKFANYISERSVEIGFEIIENEIYECDYKLKPISKEE